MDPVAAEKGSTGVGSEEMIGGVLRRAAVVEEMRSKVAAGGGATLLLDAGDHFTGSLFFTFFQGEAELTILDFLSYDASALGNHDFDGRRRAGQGGPATAGLAHLQRMTRKFAPGLTILCGNVLDTRTGSPALAPYCVLEPLPGLRVGVAAVLGPQAWEVTPVASREGFEYACFLESARASATALREQHGCSVLVCLSHTGVDRGDQELAALGLYDVVFSGHQHNFVQTSPPLPMYPDAHFRDDDGDGDVALGGLPRFGDRAKGSGSRLGLLCRGACDGQAVCFVRLTVDLDCKTEVRHQASGARLLDGPMPDVLAPGHGTQGGAVVRRVHEAVEKWRQEFKHRTNAVVGVVGHAFGDFAVGAPAQYVGEDYRRSLPCAVAEALRHEMSRQLVEACCHEGSDSLREEREGGSVAAGAAGAAAAGAAAQKEVENPGSLIVIMNRGSCKVNPSLPSGPITLGAVMERLPFPEANIVVDVRGDLLAAMVRRNERFLPGADFLFLHGVDYEVAIDGKPPAQVSGAGSVNAGGSMVVTTSAPSVAGQPVGHDRWYRAITTAFILDTLLCDVRQPGDERRRRGLPGGDSSSAKLCADYMRRGHMLGLAAMGDGHGPVGVAPAARQ